MKVKLAREVVGVNLQIDSHTEMATLNTVRKRKPLKCLSVKVIFLIISVSVVVLMRHLSINMLSQLFLQRQNRVYYIFSVLFSALPSTHA